MRQSVVGSTCYGLVKRRSHEMSHEIIFPLLHDIDKSFRDLLHNIG